MRKIILLLFVIMPTLCLAQQVRWEVFSQSIDSTDVDTTWFAFRPKGFLSNAVDPDSVAINPPDEVECDESPMVTIRQTAGTAADSLIAYAKPLDFAGRIITGDSIFVLGSTFAAPATPNTFGDGRLYGKTLAFNTKRYNGFIIIISVFDLIPGSKKFEFGFGTR